LRFYLGLTTPRHDPNKSITDSVSYALKKLNYAIVITPEYVNYMWVINAVKRVNALRQLIG